MAEIEVKEQCKKCFHFQVCANVLKQQLYIREKMLKEENPECENFVPAADVVEVVRCKDCAFSREMYASEKKIFMQDCVGCTHLSMAGHAVIMSADGFCSYGERRPFK